MLLSLPTMPGVKYWYHAIIFVIICSTAIPLTQAVVEISSLDCEKSKGCWFEPQGCASNPTGDTKGCSYGATWERTSDGHSVVFELLANVMGLNETAFYISNWGSYVSIAFSHDAMMGEDSVIDCVQSQNSAMVKPFISFNDDTHSERIFKAGSMLAPHPNNDSEYGGLVDGQLRCRIKRLIELPSDLKNSDDGSKIFSLDGDYKLMLSKGNADSQTFTPQMHFLGDGDFFPWTTREKINVANDGIDSWQMVDKSTQYVLDIPRSRQYTMIAWHGILMLFGWWFFGAVGMLSSRHFKKNWPGKKLLGEQVWYQLHRDLFIISIVLQVIGLILAFVQNGGWLGNCSRKCDRGDHTKRIHTWIGMVATCVAVLQWPIAIVRPSPTHSLRPVFNVFHWFAGMGSFILAIIAMFTSITLGKSGLLFHWVKYEVDYVMGAWVALYILVSIILEILTILSERRSRATIRPDDPVGLMSGPISMRPKAKNTSIANGSVAPAENGATKATKGTELATISGKALNSGLKQFTKKEVADHNEEENCWIILHDKVYDVSKYLDEHPGGGEAIMDYAGVDGTRGFEDFDHSEFARNLKEDYLIGEIVDAEKKHYFSTAAYLPSESTGRSSSLNNLFSNIKIYLLVFFTLAAFAFCVALSWMIYQVKHH